jgi:hypothetical protein
MMIILAHVTGVDAAAIVAVFGLGWILGGLATARYFNRSSTAGGR